MSVRGWTVTPHAQQRRKEMRVTEARIERILSAPLMDVPSKIHNTRRMAFSEDLVVIYEPSTKSIVTVIWRSDAEEQTRESTAGRRCA